MLKRLRLSLIIFTIMYNMLYLNTQLKGIGVLLMRRLVAMNDILYQLYLLLVNFGLIQTVWQAQGTKNVESCTAYNMLKVARHLICRTKNGIC